MTTIPSVSYSADDEPHAAVEQQDGKLVVVGGSDASYFVARYDADGSLDTSFGDHGVVLGPVSSTPGGVPEQGLAVAVQPDGKIVVCGEASGGPQSFVARYDPDGTPDSGFGEGGRVGNDDLFAAHALGIQADGKIVIAGAAGGTVGLARYEPDGSPDVSFGTDGEVTSAVGGYPVGLALVSGGRIVVTGAITEGSLTARYDDDGSIDTSFGNDGESVVPGYYSASMALQADGKILLSSEGIDGTVKVNRLDADGQTDAGFGTSGTATIQAGGAFPYGALQAPVAVRADGSILVAVSTDHDIGLAHLAPDGTVDASFGGSGIATTRFDATATPFALLVRDDSRAVAVGAAGDQVFYACRAGCTFPYSHEDVVLAGYLGDGAPDESFGTAGAVLTNLRHVERNVSGSPSSVLVQPGSRIIAAGAVALSQAGDFTLARYMSDGSLDPAFGKQGLVATDTNRDGDYEMAAQGAAALGADGSVAEAGCAARFYSDTGVCDAVVVARYGQDGALDESFGRNGVVTTDRGGTERVGSVKGVLLEPDGSVAVLAAIGRARDYTEAERIDVLHFNPDGSPDEAFGEHGRLSLRRPRFRFNSLTLLQERSGDLVVAGGRGDCARVVGIRAEGALDPRFGRDGVASRCFPARFGSAGALLDSRQGILVYGGSGPGLSFARFRADGWPDRSFGSRGRRLTRVKALSDRRSAALMPSGKVVIAGSRFSKAQNSSDRRRFTLLRFNPNGTADRGFGDGGRLDTGIRGRPEAIAAVPGGGVVVAGARDFPHQPYERFTIARFRRSD